MESYFTRKKFSYSDVLELLDVSLEMQRNQLEKTSYLLDTNV